MIVWTFTCKYREQCCYGLQQSSMDAVLFSATDLLPELTLVFKHYPHLYRHVYALSLYSVLTVCSI